MQVGVLVVDDLAEELPCVAVAEHISSKMLQLFPSRLVLA